TAFDRIQAGEDFDVGGVVAGIHRRCAGRGLRGAQDAGRWRGGQGSAGAVADRATVGGFRVGRGDGARIRAGRRPPRSGAASAASRRPGGLDPACRCRSGWVCRPRACRMGLSSGCPLPMTSPGSVTPLVFVTGGVVSSLGKGIAAASLAAILEARGLRVTLMKLDPYINVDPGTMSPFQHGEV